MSLNLAFILRESAAARAEKPAILLDGFRMTMRQGMLRSCSCRGRGSAPPGFARPAPRTG